jgi:hypothetical protein
MTQTYPLPYAIYYDPDYRATYLAVYSACHTNGRLVSLQSLFHHEIDDACLLIDTPACSLDDLGRYGKNYVDIYPDLMIAHPKIYCLRTNVIDHPTVRNFSRLHDHAPVMPPADLYNFSQPDPA